jgi:ABC-type amino acid transport system permease subunit
MEFLKSRVFENVFKNQGAPLQRDSLVLVLDFGFGFLKTFSKICGSLFRGTPGLVLEFGFSFGFSLVLIWRCSLLRGSAQGRSGCGWR